MQTLFKILLTFSLVHIVNIADAQDLNPVKWAFELLEKDSSYTLIAKASIEDGWYLYNQIPVEEGPIPTQFFIKNNEDSLIHVLAKSKSDFILNTYDEMFETDLTKFYKEVLFSVNLLNLSSDGYIEYMCCDKMQCLPPKREYFNFNQKK